MHTDATVKRWDVVVVGAGAAGLATAIFAGEAIQAARLQQQPDAPPCGEPGPPCRIAVVDRAVQPGAKILVSGGGRCNVTHKAIAPDDFHGPTHTVRNILRSFTQAQTVAWFEHMGVKLKIEDTGKLFPVTDRARTVLDALLDAAQRAGTTLLTGLCIDRIEPLEEGGFNLHHPQGTLRADRVVLATGGRSLPKSGSDGLGYNLARQLGHTVTDTHAALVALVLDPSFFHAQVSGIAHQAQLSTFLDGKRIDQREGSLLWTHFGISGPLAMDASRFYTTQRGRGAAIRMSLSLCPGQGFDAIEQRALAYAQHQQRATLGALLDHLTTDTLPRRLVQTLLAYLKLDASRRLTEVSRADRRTLVHALTDLDLPVVGDRGWHAAEVTAGGVPLSEIDRRTMGSRVTPGLYLVGEILDCDGRIGGFNFQWAWCTAHLAGQALARSLNQPALRDDAAPR